MKKIVNTILKLCVLYIKLIVLLFILYFVAMATKSYIDLKNPDNYATLTGRVDVLKINDYGIHPSISVIEGVDNGKVVMLSMGKNDKNKENVEIYEGEIITVTYNKTFHHPSYNGTIEYQCFSMETDKHKSFVFKEKGASIVSLLGYYAFAIIVCLAMFSFKSLVAMAQFIFEKVSSFTNLLKKKQYHIPDDLSNLVNK